MPAKGWCVEALDHGDRAVLSVLVQRGGKLPEWKRKAGAWRLIEMADGQLHDFAEPAMLLPQFNSHTVAQLERHGFVRRRRIFVEILPEGRKALTISS